MEQAIKIIKKYEGFKPDPYLCPAGKWTIGYGSTVLYNEDGSVKERVSQDTTPMVIVELAEWQLKKHLEVEVEPIIDRYVDTPLTDNQFQALVSFVYNIGGSAFAKSTTLKVLNAGDFEAFSKEFSEWRMANGEVLDGLVKRRAEELELFNA